jgi:hypothetical protein
MDGDQAFADRGLGIVADAADMAGVAQADNGDAVLCARAIAVRRPAARRYWP